jgi:hypothetical protein
MKPRKNKDRISQIMNDPEKVRSAIQSGINDALLKHKQAGNSVCGLKDGKIYWLRADEIAIDVKK